MDRFLYFCGLRSPLLPEISVEQVDRLIDGEHFERELVAEREQAAILERELIEERDNAAILERELMEERERCDRLKECLEIERDRSSKVETFELQNVALVSDLDCSKQTVKQLSQEIENLEGKLQRKRTESAETLLYDAFYVEDLESKIEAHRTREAELESTLLDLEDKLRDRSSSRESSFLSKSSGQQLSKSSGQQLSKTSVTSGSFALMASQMPEEPQGCRKNCFH